MSGPTLAAKCVHKRLWCKYYSEAPELSWSFPYQEVPSEIRAVTDANWAGELEGLRSTSCGWIYFGDHLLETYSRAMVTRRGVGRVRHLDARLLWLQQLCAEGVVQVRARPGEHNEADFETKMVDWRRMTSLWKGTPLRPPMGLSYWMVAATLPAVAEAAKDCRVLIWNVRNMCETSG